MKSLREAYRAFTHSIPYRAYQVHRAFSPNDPQAYKALSDSEPFKTYIKELAKINPHREAYMSAMIKFECAKRKHTQALEQDMTEQDYQTSHLEWLAAKDDFSLACDTFKASKG